jgi:AraC-like DNA-binding protein
MTTIYPIIGSQTALPFYLTGIGISEPEFHVTRSEGLVSHQFLFTESGRGVLKLGECSYIQTEGSLFYLAPGVPHEYFPEADEWTTRWIVFRGEHLSELMRTMGFGEYAVGSCDERIKRIFSQLMAAANDNISGAERCSELVYEYILTARERLVKPHNEAPSGRVSGAVAYIEERFFEDITLERLANISGVSLQHFCRLFRAQTGMRPMEYLARVRVAQAKIMLRDTDEPVSAVGERCGYRDSSYFGAVFTKYEGISPSKYRETKKL